MVPPLLAHHVQKGGNYVAHSQERYHLSDGNAETVNNCPDY